MTGHGRPEYPQRAGIKDSSHSGRLGFAGKVLDTTGDMETVAVQLGHRSIDCSQRYVVVSHDTMFADAIEDGEC
jgi:site-specific recombinase XerD